MRRKSNLPLLSALVVSGLFIGAVVVGAGLVVESSSEEASAAEDGEDLSAKPNESKPRPAPGAPKLQFDMSLDELPTLEGPDEVTSRLPGHGIWRGR